MENTSLQDLLAEIQRRGINITAYTVDEQRRGDLNWERRKHAVAAWYGIRLYRRRYWAERRAAEAAAE